MCLAEVSLRVFSDVFDPFGHIRCYPDSNRESDTPDGRYVPLATKVRCSKSPFGQTDWMKLPQSWDPPHEIG